VLTNFDEYAPHFENVRLPITELMGSAVDVATMSQKVAHEFELERWEASRAGKYVINVFGNVQGLVAGDNAEVNMSFNK
jgi:hypothetical protein